MKYTVVNQNGNVKTMSNTAIQVITESNESPPAPRFVRQKAGELTLGQYLIITA